MKFCLYEYAPNEEEALPTDRKLLMLPRWSKQYGENQVQSLWFFTVPAARLTQTAFDLILDSDVLGTLTLYKEAFGEFLTLLKKHLFSQKDV